MIFAIKAFGRDDVEVEVTQDWGWESDTNAWDVEWHFVEDALNEVEISDKETDKIMEQIYDALANKGDYE